MNSHTKRRPSSHSAVSPTARVDASNSGPAVAARRRGSAALPLRAGQDAPVSSGGGLAQAGYAGAAAIGPRIKAMRVSHAPPWWRRVKPQGESVRGVATVDEKRLNLWLLVLSAKKIPFVYYPAGHTDGRMRAKKAAGARRVFSRAAFGGKKGGIFLPDIFVPPLREMAALADIRAVEAERPAPEYVAPVNGGLTGVLFFMLVLALWHGLRWGWFKGALPVPPFPPEASSWAAAFGMDAYRFRTLHEFWRAVTALTLHADDAHLFSNIGFGCLFLGALCRRAGLGFGLALAVSGGIMGNAANALTRAAATISIGFSTALFSAVGALCTLVAIDIYRQSAMWGGRSRVFARKVGAPLAVGLALLGLFGGGGEARTDYAAHVWGFFGGILAVLLAECAGWALAKGGMEGAIEGGAWRGTKGAARLAQPLLYAAVLLTFVLAWEYALFAR